jgi:hypothetical protein
MQVQKPTTTESVSGQGAQLIDTLKNIVHEGNVRKVIVKQDGRTIAEFPLTLGVVGAAIAPPLAAIGAIAALVSDCSIEIEREQDA